MSTVEYPIGGGAVVLIDEEDALHVARFAWSPQVHPRTTYAQTNIWRGDERGTLTLHRFIARAADNEHVDHENGDGLDCRKSNLRVCARFQNNRNARTRVDNSAGYKGVSWYKARSAWSAGIQIGNSRRHIGYFETREQAARAYDLIALRTWGDFAWLNFPDDRPADDDALNAAVTALLAGRQTWLARQWGSVAA